MYEPVKFKKLGEIARELSSKLEDLQFGNLSSQELEALTEHSRELYERLVVLRFKAYTSDVKGEEETTPAAPVVDETPVAPVAEEKPIVFKVAEEKAPEVSPNQVNLIDAIEEVTKSEWVEEPAAEVETAEETPALEINDIPLEIETSQVEEPQHLFAPKAPEPVKNTLFSNAPESLHDKLVKTVGQTESLASKLENTPIQDLKKAITLNQRFQFSKELFKGNNQDYEVAIDRLNSATRDEAMKQLASLKSKYAWSEDSPVAADFVDLVERRYS